VDISIESTLASVRRPTTRRRRPLRHSEVFSDVTGDNSFDPRCPVQMIAHKHSNRSGAENALQFPVNGENRPVVGPNERENRRLWSMRKNEKLSMDVTLS